MEAAFAWIGAIADWIGRFVPRFIIVRSTHAGVKFRHGRTPIALRPGLRFYWPLVTEAEVIPVTRQTHTLPTQALLTSDGRRVVVSGIVVYRIKDIVATLARNWDISDTLNDLTMVAITHVVTTHTLDYLLAHLNDEVQEKLTKVTRKKLHAYGVSVYWTALTEFAECMVVKCVADSSARPLVLPQNG